MPISIDYDSEKNVIYTKAEDVLARNDIISYYSSIATLDLKPEYRVLADYSNAELDLSYKEISEMSAMRNTTLGEMGIIMIAFFSNKDLVFGVTRMFQALLDEKCFKVGVFREKAEAINWLGI